MTDDYDLGSAADWSTRMASLAEPSILGEDDPDRLRGLRLVGEVAARGPRSAEEAARIADDPELRRLLARAWSHRPPSDELRSRLRIDPSAAGLIDLLPQGYDEASSGDAPFDEWDLALFVELLDVGVSRSTTDLPTGDTLRAEVTVSGPGGEHDQATVTVGLTLERGAWQLTVGGVTGTLRVHLRWSDGHVTSRDCEPRTARRPVTVESRDREARPVGVWVESLDSSS
jgi:hypothetical protein